MSEDKFQEFATLVEAQRNTDAIWAEYCEERGTTAAAIAAGTDSLDFGPDGKKKFPPRSTGVNAPIPARKGGKAALIHSASSEKYNGRMRMIGGVPTTIVSSAATAKTRAQLSDDDLRDGVDDVTKAIG